MEISNFIIQENTSIIDALAAIDANSRQIVFVCAGSKLLASLSDGDIRRYILRSEDVSKSVCNAANYCPISLTVEERSKANQLMKKYDIRAIPIVNSEGDIVSIELENNEKFRKNVKLGIPVVIMAGGKGTRLAPYTDILPKPLIPVGDITITEHIIERFLHYGCDDFTMIVNHKKELIKAYFNETECKGNLRFVEEDFFQGTGGGLKLLEGTINDTFFMTNCDTLIEADYEDMLKHHRKNEALVTMVCALKKISVPYGTVEIDKYGNLVHFVEKPEYSLLINTGFYVIDIEFLDIISSGEFVHITELIQRLVAMGRPVSIYPINESGWFDMGEPEGFSAMNQHLMGNAKLCY